MVTMVKEKASAPSKAKAHGSLALPEPHDLVSRDKVIAIIAAKVRLPGDTFRQSKDKVGKRIAYAVKKGWLDHPVKKRFVFGDVVRWARQRRGWGDKLAGLPLTDPPKALPVPVRAAHVAIHDLSLKDCHALLAEVSDQLRAALDELNRLRPQAARWARFMATRTKGQK
jgi:hypothetical protein